MYSFEVYCARSLFSSQDSMLRIKVVQRGLPIGFGNSFSVDDNVLLRDATVGCRSRTGIAP